MAEGEDVKMTPKLAETLKAMGVEAGALDRRTVGQLERIEAAIAAEAAAYRAARAEVRAHLLTGENVSRVSGVTKPTINAKPVLKGYIERRRAEEKVFNESERIAALKGRLREAESKLEKMIRRDAELVVAIAETDRLRERVRRLDEYVRGLPPYMQEELEAMGRVIPFPDSGE